jgi:PAS domain S-box-containing protein
MARSNCVRDTLQQSEEQFRSLSACCPLGIYLTDLAGRCTYTNPRCRELLGLCLEETLGEGWARVVHPADRQDVLTRWAECSGSGGTFSMEYRIVGPRDPSPPGMSDQ